MSGFWFCDGMLLEIGELILQRRFCCGRVLDLMDFYSRVRFRADFVENLGVWVDICWRPWIKEENAYI